MRGCAVTMELVLVVVVVVVMDDGGVVRCRRDSAGSEGDDKVGTPRQVLS